MCKGDMNHHEPKTAKIILLGRVDRTNWLWVCKGNQFIDWLIKITNLVTRADHAHFVAVRCTKWVWSARKTKNLGGHETLATHPFSKKI